MELRCLIDLFSGKLQLCWNDDRLDTWCAESLTSLYTCFESRLPLVEALDRQYEYALLFTVKELFAAVNTFYTSVLTHQDSQPVLLLPCHMDRDTATSSVYHRYQLLLTLTHENAEPDDSSSVTMPSAETLLRRGKASYHSINNKVDVLPQLAGESEIGFDIDGDEPQSTSSEADDVSPWSLEIIGLYECNAPVQSRRMEEVRRVVPCGNPSSSEFRDQVCYAIQKLLPRLRFESLHDALAHLEKGGYITNVLENREQRTATVGFHCVCNSSAFSRTSPRKSRSTWTTTRRSRWFTTPKDSTICPSTPSASHEARSSR